MLVCDDQEHCGMIVIETKSNVSQGATWAESQVKRGISDARQRQWLSGCRCAKCSWNLLICFLAINSNSISINANDCLAFFRKVELVCINPNAEALTLAITDVDSCLPHNFATARSASIDIAD